MEKVPDIHVDISTGIPGIGDFSFDIPIPIYYESFSHKIAMDFTIINENLEKWKTNLDQMETALIDADLVVHSDLRFSWQGNDASEFFAAYDPMYKSLIGQLEKLREMAKLLRDEIEDFKYMQRHLINV
jgi:uncharacterized protein YukE